MKKVWKIAIPVLLALLALMLILLMTSPSFSNRVFEDILDFQKLDAFSVKALTMDDKAAELKPLEAYHKEIVWEDNTYSVQAYVFQDVTAAQTYFAHVTGKESELTGNFSGSGNYLFYTRYIVYYENRLYQVEGGNHPAVVRFVNWLNTDFPVDLDSVLKSEVTQ